MTVSKRYEAYLEVNKSKFYAILCPLENVDDFKALLESIKKEHKKAKHVVYAYRVGDKSRSSDDQEPKGTAGRPLLELLHIKKIDNAVIFVARHFGGTLLGAGRLQRTYRQAGVMATEKMEEDL